jgi:hypothetical protein
VLDASVLGLHTHLQGTVMVRSGRFRAARPEQTHHLLVAIAHCYARTYYEAQYMRG